ncbi:MAG: GNAT family N-acetyltransferase [Allosphingosinicella sp.]
MAQVGAPSVAPHSEDRIVTDRLVLRPARPDDLAAMHAVLSDARAMLYWSTPPHASLDETRDWLAGMIDRSDDFIIEQGGELIGKAGCWRVPEIGFILRPDCWGRGLAREAVSAIIPRLFARFAFPAITADVDPRNLASLKLLKGLGFEETGKAARTWLVGETWCDSIYLALPRPPSS